MGCLFHVMIGPASTSVSRCGGLQEDIKIASNILLDVGIDLGLQGLIEDGAGNVPGPVAC